MIDIEEHITHRRTEPSLHAADALMVPGLAEDVEHVGVDTLAAVLGELTLQLQSGLGDLGGVGEGDLWLLVRHIEQYS